MRGAAISVWIFINLLCFGMCGYLYLIWSQYWMYIEKQRLFSKSATDESGAVGGGRDPYASDKYVHNYYTLSDGNASIVGPRKNRRSAVGVFRRGGGRTASGPAVESALRPRPSAHVVLKSDGSPRFPNVHTPVLEFDSDRYVCYDLNAPDCDLKTAEYKWLLLKEFHRVLMIDSNVFESGVESKNPYNVRYAGDRSGVRREMSGRELACALRRVPVGVVTARDEPFRSLGYRVPAGEPLAGRVYNTCAVVTSAGALLGSQLGQFIDSHEAVVRFNNAPTANYSADVGSKTTVRVLNSQVVTKPEFNFLEDPMYRSVALLIWDPANYSSTLEEWYRHPDFPLFPVYKRYLESGNGSSDAWLLRPASLWALWATLQDAAPYRLRRHPPSSGFIGMWFALHRCGRVRVFEYVPSARAARRCHYYAPARDAACTLGAWHPLAMEKAFAEKIRDNSDKEVFQSGYIDIPGFRTLVC